MANITLTFNLDKEPDSANNAIKADSLHLCLWDTAEELFRPPRRNGYQDEELHQALEKCGDAGKELVAILEKRFYAILEDRDIKIN